MEMWNENKVMQSKRFGRKRKFCGDDTSFSVTAQPEIYCAAGE